MKNFIVLILLASCAATIFHVSATAADDPFQRALNYFFTGDIDPKDSPEIVDKDNCTVVLPQPALNRYARYYLSRFNMDNARINKIYSGSQTRYFLDVVGDGNIVEFLRPDKVTLDYGLRSVQIPLPGNLELSEKALKIVFEECRAKKPAAPF